MASDLRGDYLTMRRRRIALGILLPLIVLLAWWDTMPVRATTTMDVSTRMRVQRSSISPDHRPSANKKRVLWKRVDANIVVHEDGTFDVEEVLEVFFIGGPFTYGYRDIPADLVGDITDLHLWDEAGTYTHARARSDHTFTLNWDRKVLHLHWYFSPVEDVARTFHLTYRVHGGLRAYPDGDQLWWKAVFPDRDGYVIVSTVTVTVPGPVQVYKAYFVPAKIDLPNGRTVRFRAEYPIPPGVPFEVRVQWPHGIIPITPEPWQAQADAEAHRTEWLSAWHIHWLPIVEVGLVFGSIGLGVAGLLTLLLLWYLRGRDTPVPPIAYLSEPPSDLPPGLAGLLVDMYMKPRHLLATLVDLAHRGILVIEEREKRLSHTPERRGLARYLFSGPEKDIRLRLSHGFPEDLPAFEHSILRGVMGRSQERRLKELRNRFHKHVPRIREVMDEALIERRLFPYRPYTRRQMYTMVGGGLMWLPLLLFFFVAFNGAKRLGIDDRLTLFPLGTLFLLGMVTVIVARFMPRRTPRGAEEAERWRAFRRYLQNLRTLGDTPPAEDVLERYLPYAIAFGVEKAFLATWEDAVGEEVATWPAWYHPALGTHGEVSSMSVMR